MLSLGRGGRQWRIVCRADVCGALFDGLRCHSQAAAPNGLVQAISRVGRLGVVAVTDWVVELTAHKWDFYNDPHAVQHFARRLKVAT